MPDYPPGYDPSQADYISAEDQAIGAALTLGVIGAIVIGTFGLVDAPAVAAGARVADALAGVTDGDLLLALEQEMLASGMTAAELAAWQVQVTMARGVVSVVVVASADTFTSASTVEQTGIMDAMGRYMDGGIAGGSGADGGIAGGAGAASFGTLVSLVPANLFGSY